MKALTENTAVSLTLATAIAGGAFWLSAMFSQTRENTLQIAEIKQDVKILAEVRSDQKWIMDALRRLEPAVRRTDSAVKSLKTFPYYACPTLKSTYSMKD